MLFDVVVLVDVVVSGAVELVLAVGSDGLVGMAMGSVDGLVDGFIDGSDVGDVLVVEPGPLVPGDVDGELVEGELVDGEDVDGLV